MSKIKKLLSLILAFSMLLSSFTSVFAIDLQQERTKEKSIKNSDEYVSIIIELSDKPLLDCVQARTFGANEYLQSDTAKDKRDEMITNQENIQNEIVENIDPDCTFRFNYTNTINEFAAVVKKSDIEKIKELYGVKKVYADLVYKVPEDNDPRLKSSTDIIGAQNIWSDVKYKGQGTVIAIIDDGVDVNHEYMVLSDDTTIKLSKESITHILEINNLNAEKVMTDKKLSLAADDVYYNKKFPYCFDYVDMDTDAYPVGTHGVHVSGIAAANGTVAVANAKKNGTSLHTTIEFNGVAPEAQIIGMKVFPDNGLGAPTSCTIAAVEDAVMLGVDAINLSLGSTAGFSFYEGTDLTELEEEYSFAIARKAGIIVAVASGNEDRIGMLSYLSNITVGMYFYPSTEYVDNGTMGSPGTKYHATTVASIENMTEILPYMTTISGKMFYYSDKTDFAQKLDGQAVEYVVIPGLGELKDFEGIDVKGKIALIERGEIEFSVKVANAQMCGAIGAIIYNNEANADYIDSMKLSGVDIPAVLITRDSGTMLKDEENKKIVVDNSCKEGTFETKKGGQMSDFTSWGCNPDLKLKPEITAPGTNIYSTSTDNKYEMMNGTSMACPHIAGAAALLQQYVKNDDRFDGYTAEEKANIIESLLMSTADIIYNEYGEQYSPRRQGAGLADLKAAIDTDVYLLNAYTGKAKVELGDNIGNEFTVEFDAFNLSQEAHEYQLIGSVFSECDVRIELPSEENNTADMGHYILPYSNSFKSSEMLSDGHIINTATLATTSSAITGSAIVVVPAGGHAHIKVTVNLNENDISSMNDAFKNGFFVEGFIELQTVNKDQPDLSVPYMGFYGDWNKSSILDGSYYFDNYCNPDGSRNFFYGDSCPYSYMYDKDSNLVYGYNELGSNYEKTIYSKNYIAISPNEDNVCDEMGYSTYFLRNAKSLNIYIEDSKGNIVKNILDDIYLNKSYPEYDNDEEDYFMNPVLLDTWDGTDEDNILVDDGQYYYNISATIDYPGAAPQITKIPVKVDTQKPEIIDYSFNKEKMILTVKSTDNTYISYAGAIDTASDEKNYEY